MTSLFSTAYLPPVSYLQQIIRSDQIIIDRHEHFIKQTYRNRCNIYGPNGKQTLVIPVIHDNLFRIPINEVKISFETPWNKIHWKSICSAYRNSPYFEYYEDDFRNAFESPSPFLFEFNLKMLTTILGLFKIKKTISFSQSFEKETSSAKDFRKIFHPKKNHTILKPYHQVFSERHGFINDLSCVDLLFNERIQPLD